VDVESRQTLLSEGLLIAGVSLAGYSIAFAYEAGYAGYYGIPWQFISLTLTNVLASIAGLLVVLSLLFNLYNMAYILFCQGDTPHPAIVELARLGPLSLLLLGALFIFGVQWQAWSITLTPVALVFVFKFILPLLTRRDKATYRAKLLAQKILAQSVSVPLDVVTKAYGNQPIQLFVSIGCLVALAFLVGRAKAINEKNYYVDSSTPNVVILRFYGDTLVAHQYDPRENKLTGDLLVKKVSDKQQLQFKMKMLGHLEGPTP